MTLSLLVAVTGHPAAVEEDAVALVEALQEALSDDPALQAVLALDSPEWLKALPIRRSPQLTVITARRPGDRPAVLFNLALAEASGERVAFAWPGVDLIESLPAVRRLAERADADDLSFIASASGPGETRRLPPHSWLANETDGLPAAYPLGWLQLVDRVPMHEAVVDTALVRRLGFDEDAALQAGFWWAFCLQAARVGDLRCSGEPASAARSWRRHPFTRTTPGTGDAAARVVMDRQSVAPAVALTADGAAELDGDRLERPWTGRLKVTVLGGVNEPAHNQLCFFNYFERLRALGWLSWRTVLDTAAHELDVLGADLVIFSRVKTEAGRRLIDLCARHGVPTLYMIDDNWFRVADDVPLYRKMFAPDAPSSRVFRHCLEQADLTLVYNPILEEDVRPYARETARIETNIDLSLFPTAERRGGPGRTKLGYVGSARTDTVAVDALCEIVAARPELELFFMSGELPDSVRRVPEDRRTVAPYLFDYTRYARTVCEAAPDILLAPLGDTMFERSKCPNKYLEITAAGAVGVYSDNGLYRRYVRDGVNGFLVEQHTPAGWRAAIERAIAAGPQQRREMAARAYLDVHAGFRTEARMRDLLGVLARAVTLGRDRARRREASDAPSGSRILETAAAA